MGLVKKENVLRLTYSKHLSSALRTSTFNGRSSIF